MFERYEYKFKNAVEVEERHSFRHAPPGSPRQKSNKPSPETMAKVNQWLKEKKCRHRLRKFFKPNDLFVTLTYRKEERPSSMEEAKEHFAKFLRKIRKYYKQSNTVLFWIRNIEVGSRGAWHIHMCINRIPETDTGLLIADAWPYGYIDTKFIRQYREYHELAAYMVKSPRTEKRQRERSRTLSSDLCLFSC